MVVDGGVDIRPITAVISRPLPPIHHPSNRLVDLAFYCPPPAPPTGTPGKPESKTLHLVATFFDIDDCRYSISRLVAMNSRTCHRFVITKIRAGVVHVHDSCEPGLVLGTYLTCFPSAAQPTYFSDPVVWKGAQETLSNQSSLLHLALCCPRWRGRRICGCGWLASSQKVYIHKDDNRCHRSAQVVSKLVVSCNC